MIKTQQIGIKRTHEQAQLINEEEQEVSPVKTKQL
jgi:hypothetical protein